MVTVYHGLCISVLKSVYMEFSEHYTPFAEKTLIVLTNNDQARLLSGLNRDVEEIDTLTISVPDRDDFDAYKAAQLAALGKSLTKRMQTAFSKEGFATGILCIPEVNREQLLSHMNKDAVEKCELVSKNLCAMELSVVVRILLER